MFGVIGIDRGKWLLFLRRIATAKHRRSILALRMLERAKKKERENLRTTSGTEDLQWVGRDIIDMLRRKWFREVASYLLSSVSTKEIRNKIFVEAGASSEFQRKRKIPYDIQEALPAILRLPKVRHRRLAVKWIFGRFPPLRTTLLQEKLDDIVKKHLDTLQENSSRYHLGQNDTEATEQR